jgi:hypothetical protein
MPSSTGIAASSAKMRCGASATINALKTAIKPARTKYRRFPHVFDYPGVNPGHPTGVAMSASQTLDSSGSKVVVGGDLPRKMFWRDKAGRGRRMIPRFTMRQALSAPDLLGNAFVTPPLPAWCRLLGQRSKDSVYDVQLLGSSSSSSPAHEADDEGLHRIFNKKH